MALLALVCAPHAGAGGVAARRARQGNPMDVLLFALGMLLGACVVGRRRAAPPRELRDAPTGLFAAE